MFSLHLCTFVIICLINGQAKARVVNTATEATINTEDRIDLTQFGGRMFGPPQPAAGEMLESLAENSQQIPEEMGPYLEGDMLVPQSSGNDKGEGQRNGLIAYSSHWPAAIVPYELRGQFSEKELALIRYAFREYHNKTCVRFKPRRFERDYVVIANGNTGCWSSLGRIGGRQVVNMQSPNCFRYFGTFIHELMHVLGFRHEHTRHERDSYIRVLAENVQSGLWQNFEKVAPGVEDNFGVPYDYASVLHYSRIAFTKNGKPTIEAVRNTEEAKWMGQRYGFSKGDIAKVKAMYKCS